MPKRLAQQRPTTTLRLLIIMSPRKKNTADCFTIESAIEYAHNALQSDPSIVRKLWLEEVLQNYITVNFIFNESLTNKIEQTALSNISTTRGMVQKGELIAEKDKIINNDTY